MTQPDDLDLAFAEASAAIERAAALGVPFSPCEIPWPGPPPADHVTVTYLPYQPSEDE